MALFRCKMCGGSLEIEQGTSVATCEYCGTQQTLPRLDDERKANLYDRASHFRRNNEFDRAMGIYEQVLNEDHTDAESYWSLVLCRYGVEYVEDPSSNKRIPTINRAQFVSIFDDDDYKSALRYADEYQRSVYEAEANVINKIQKGFLAISQKEAPFDVFICYKESDEKGRRTPDSVLAQDLYYLLVQEGYKVFFSRITLEDKLGSAYEPYIFAALNSAKVMVVLGTKPEYFNAVWVKNEWSRYLALIKNGAKKMLVPAYKDMNPYDLPEEFSHLQAQDMSKLGFMQDLIRGIRKIIEVDKPLAAGETKTRSAPNGTEVLIKRATIFLEDGNVQSANDYCEKALDIDPECAEAYVIKLLIDLKLNTREALNTYAEPFDSNPNYLRAIRYGDESLRFELDSCLENIRNRNEQARIEGIYTSAAAQMKSARLEETFIQLAQQFESVISYQDAGDLAAQCRSKAAEARKDAIYAEAKTYMSKTAVTIADLEAAVKGFKTISGWRDSDDRIAACEKKIADIKAKEENDRLEQLRRKEIERREAEKRARQNKKTMMVFAAIFACAAIIFLWTGVLSPLFKYNKAQSLFDDGSYDEAIELYTELDQYKDASAKILEVKYAKAEQLLADKDYDAAAALYEELADYNNASERLQEVDYSRAGDLLTAGNYANAAAIYQSLGTYKDSAALYPSVVLEYAAALVEEKEYSNAESQLQLLAEYEEYDDSISDVYLQMMSACSAEGKYDEALAAYQRTKDYSEDSEQYKELVYKFAESLYQEQDYSAAVEKYKLVPGYLDADEKAQECSYHMGVEAMSQKDYTLAIQCFTDAGSYKDSAEQLKEAKQQYVLSGQGDKETTDKYLNELNADQNKGSAVNSTVSEKQDKLKARIIVNTSWDDRDYVTDMLSVPKSDVNIRIHVLLSSITQNTSIDLLAEITNPRGKTKSVHATKEDFNRWSLSSWSYREFVDGTGTYIIRVYDTDKNLLAEKSVEITGESTVAQYADNSAVSEKQDNLKARIIINTSKDDYTTDLTRIDSDNPVCFHVFLNSISNESVILLYSIEDTERKHSRNYWYPWCDEYGHCSLYWEPEKFVSWYGSGTVTFRVYNYDGDLLAKKTVKFTT